MGSTIKSHDFLGFLRYRYLFDKYITNHYLDLYAGYEKKFSFSNISVQPRAGILGTYLLHSSMPDGIKVQPHLALQTQLSIKLNYHLNDVTFYIEPMWKVNLKQQEEIYWNNQKYTLDPYLQEWSGKIGVIKNIGNVTFDLSTKLTNHKEKNIIATINYQF